MAIDFAEKYNLQLMLENQYRILDELQRFCVQTRGHIQSIKDQGIQFMFKNKYGLNKEEAKKLFYDFRSKSKEPGGEDDDSSQNTESVEGKIAMIMDYMKETSTKLDRIEDDISTLKRQVEHILKKI